MARSFARIAVTRYSDPDWRCLSFAEQGVYDLLLTHPKMSLCGVLDVKLNVLAATARGGADELTGLLEALEAGRWVKWDRETHELAVRTFVRHDGSLKNGNLVKGMWSSWAAVESVELRQFVVENLPAKAFEPQFDPPSEALRIASQNSGSDQHPNLLAVAEASSANGSNPSRPVDNRGTFLPGTGWVS